MSEFLIQSFPVDIIIEQLIVTDIVDIFFINIVLLEIVKPRSRAFTAAHSEISPFFIGKIP